MKKAYIFEGINVHGEDLTNLRFAEYVPLFNEKHFNSLKSESLKTGQKYTRERQNT